MTDPSTHEVTELLAAWRGGDKTALEQLIPLVHAELRRLAHRYMGRERAGHTLQTSALVNEAYARLIRWEDARFENRAHFFGVSAQLMRRILVDFARSRRRAAEGPARRVSIDVALPVACDERGADVVALDEALEALADLDPRKSRIVELRFFGGLTVEETAEFLDISAVTVMREWAKAKAWLYRELSAEKESGDAG
ncbi:MAG TPA: sigma-70 family RNA polymerase sigma factor [Pyrinomonadaceae bacterium]|jgi:RNA polymerase sigma factor (TIGR02999 family)|nr:sigma-70 family RNA polymerase sigma factor [Pyrinomonadaceae bacterium]